MALQGGAGNAAAQDLMNSQDLTWRERGNLIGSPPVRSESQPPNTGIVEDESTYSHRYDAASHQYEVQKSRADALLSESGDPLDNRYWFAKVYSYVTEGELHEARSSTYFYPSFVLECVRYFDKIYVDNAAAADGGRPVEEHWQAAFDAASDEGLTWNDTLDLVTGDLYRSVWSMVQSMQAHIRYDLSRSVAWVYQSHYSQMEDAQVGQFGADFMAMTGIFDRAAVKMNTEIANLHHLPANIMPRTSQDLAMAKWFSADMATERALTWERAEQLVEEGLVGTDPYQDTEDGHLLGDITGQDNMSNLQQLSDARLRPTMDASSNFTGQDATAQGYIFGDSQGRDEIASMSDAEVKKMSFARRAQIIRRCMTGLAFNADEDTVLRVLRCSLAAGDLVATVDAANAYDILVSTDFSQYNKIRALFQRSYYAQMVQANALTYIRRCMDGMTTEFQQDMIVDILYARKFVNADGEIEHDLQLSESQAHLLISEIGLTYSGGGYDEGLMKLEWQLDGGDQTRLNTHFGDAQANHGDAAIRDRVAADKDAVQNLPLRAREAMMNRLLSGATFNGDEDTIIEILNQSRSNGDHVALIDRVYAHTIASSINGAQWKTVHSFFKDSYYPYTSQGNAFRLICSCITGYTSGWEQEMVADIISSRADANQMVTRVGGYYERGGFDEGLSKLQWQLTGSSQRRVEAAVED
jgi:hypothetical protein